MPYVSGNKYNLIESDQVKTKFVHGQGWKKCLLSNFILSTNKEGIACGKNTFLEEYVEVKEETIENSKELNEDMVIEEGSEVKIVEKIIEEPIIEKDLKVKMVETIKEKIKDESFKDLNKIKSYNCQSQDPLILVVSDAPKFNDFIGVDRFDSIVSSYLVNLYNHMKTKEKEIQVDLFIPLMSCK